MTPLATLHDRRRYSDRREVEIDATVRLDGRPLDAIVFNLSATGCLFFCSEALQVGDTMTIGIAGIGRQPIKIIRVAHSRYGAEFEKSLQPADLAIAAEALGNLVVSLPKQHDNASISEEETTNDEKLPAPTRFLIVAGTAIFGWIAIFAVFKAL